MPLSRQLDHVGPLARSVADAALLFDVLCGVPAASSAGRETPAPSSFRLAMLGGYFIDRLSPGVDTAVRAAIEAVAHAGATMTTASLPHALASRRSTCISCSPTRPRITSRSLERRPHAYTAERAAAPRDGPQRARRGLRARRTRQGDHPREVTRALDGVDALVLPALSIEAPPIGAATVPVIGGDEPVRTAMLRCTQPFNLSGHPAISVPCGTTRAGLPVGLQIVGHHGRTADLAARRRDGRARPRRSTMIARFFHAGKRASPTSAGPSASSVRSSGASTGCRSTVIRATVIRSGSCARGSTR